MTVLSFVEDDFEPGIFFAGAEEGCEFATQDFVAFGFDSSFEGFDQVRVGYGGDLHVIGLVEVCRGICNTGVPFGIVGE